MVLALPPNVILQESTFQFLHSSPKKLFIDGEWVTAKSGETFPTYNPAIGEELARVALAGPQDVDRAVQAARAAYAQGVWSKTSGYERGELLWRLADLIDQHADELAELETLDNG